MSEELLQDYGAELQEDLDIDDLNITDKQMKLPSLKHKWVARLIKHKNEKGKLQELRKEAIEKIVDQIRENQPISISEKGLRAKAAQHEVIIKIDSKLRRHDLIIDYLERVEVVCRSMTYDIKNIIEIQKLETM